MYKIAIIGLGLMGGSLAYALKGFKGASIVGMDIDARVCERALGKKAVEEAYCSIEPALANADLVIFCVFPHLIPKLILKNRSAFKGNVIVTDICGVKTNLYKTIEPNIPPNIEYIGIHPMAGREVGGFENADGALFKNTGFLITPFADTKPETITLMRELAEHIGATRTAVTSYEAHDEIIAYSSDLMHIAAACLCMDSPSEMTPAYTAGAYRDCTRVANIDAKLWTELLLDNREFTIKHLSRYIERLTDVRDALEKQDEKSLTGLLQLAGDNKREWINKWL